MQHTVCILIISGLALLPICEHMSYQGTPHLHQSGERSGWWSPMHTNTHYDPFQDSNEPDRTNQLSCRSRDVLGLFTSMTKKT